MIEFYKGQTYPLKTKLFEPDPLVDPLSLAFEEPDLTLEDDPYINVTYIIEKGLVDNRLF
jgi:hypothetical protein